MKIVFISGAYRASTPNGIYDNIYKARQVALKYWKKGYAVICPHMNTMLFDGEADDQTWLDGDIEILKRCDAIVMMKDWEKSDGARTEFTIAIGNQLEIIYDYEKKGN